MELRLVSVPSGFGRHIGTALALAVGIGIAACGSEEDCSATDSCPNAAPSATITAPADGATVDEFQSVSFQGSASDAEDGALTGSSLVWSSSLDGSIGTGTSLSRNDLTAGDHVITLTATDTEGASGSSTVDLKVNAAPTVEITSPADGGSATAGDDVTFSGTASDPEEGALTGASLIWTSDLDGTLGTGGSITVNTLSGGTHEIVLTATDSEGAFGTDAVSFTITTAPNQAPSATITAPVDGATVDEFQSVSFQGSASDPEDGSLAGSSLVWDSSLDGSIGTGTSFSRNDLTPGDHVITLTATDSEGASGSVTADLTVNDLPNEAPSAEITSPTDGGSAAAGESVTFTGSATDPEEGALSGTALVWTSDLDGALGTGASITTNTLSGGTHEIVLTASDNDGAFGADTIAFTITTVPTVQITAPTDQASGAPHTVFEGTGVTFSGSATDAEDGPLTGGSLEWTSNVDGQFGTGESFSTSSLSPGLHTVTLTATDSDMNEAKATVLAIVKPPTTGGYQIHIRWSEGVELTAAQQTAVEEAVTKLESIITGDVANIPTTEFPDVGTCGGASIPKMQESVDDVIIYLEFVPIDGPNGTVGSAGPCFSRTGTALSLVGGMRFDTADLATLESFGLLDDIVLHEMMHVLGFGIFWESPVDYLEQPSNSTNPDYDPMNTDTHFTGPEAVARFDSIGGDSYTGGEVVPVENDTDEYGPGSLDGHWRESVFANEIMTPAANATNPLSELTVAQFVDLGYTVDYDAADPYAQVFSIVLEPHADVPVVDLSDDIWRGELHEIGPDGSVRRIR